jgi:predicted flap endonuclease-1-like 5' DNA nuclease
MLFWLGLVAGAIIGWVIEWVIDWRFWRRGLDVTTDEESRLRKELEVARLEISNLQNRLQQSPLTPERDRLQDIDGIGPVFAQKLNEAGITTFVALGESSVARLTEIIKPQEWQSLDFDSWIRQARAFAQATHPTARGGN